jgi:hypothetical protein
VMSKPTALPAHRTVSRAARLQGPGGTVVGGEAGISIERA